MDDRWHRPRDRSGWRILIVGTGGQGALTAARLLCEAFVAHDHHVVSGQLHGMAQRGGSVQASVMIDCGISPVIASGGADFVLGFEPVETARALPYTSSRTVVYMNTIPVIPYVVGQRSVLKEEGAVYPDVNELADRIRAVTPHVLCVDATRLALQAGSAKTLNMVMLGCLVESGSLPFTVDAFWSAAAKNMPPRLVDMNTKAFMSGVEAGRTFQLDVEKR
jgi:indolepyruvate ferredoxin oxidoreductase beta subunit